MVTIDYAKYSNMSERQLLNSLLNAEKKEAKLRAEFQEKINRKEIDVCLVLYWKNQYGYEYKQNISMSYEQYKSRNDMYVSTKETFEIEYIK